MRVTAKTSFVRQSPYKVRQVIDLIRGHRVNDAFVLLDHANRRAAEPVRKLIESAVANAEHNFALDGDELVIDEIYANEGPTLKRFRPRARGRATRIRKRTSHISVVLSDGRDEFEMTELETEDA